MFTMLGAYEIASVGKFINNYLFAVYGSD